MSGKNIEQLIESHYEFVIGVRIKKRKLEDTKTNLRFAIKKWPKRFHQQRDLRLIISY